MRQSDTSAWSLGAAPGAAAGGHLRQRLRAGRDRAGPVPEGLRVWLGGFGLEASGQRLSKRPVAELDQGEELEACGHDARYGTI